MNKEICSPRIFVPLCVAWALLLATVMLFSSTPGRAQTNPRNTESPAAAGVRALNNSLLQLHGQAQRAAPNQMGGLRSQAATIVAQRSAALTTLIQNDPRGALSFAFSPELLADLAAKFPQSSPLLESHATLTGKVQHWIIDYPRGSRSWWQMNAGGRTLNLFFAGQEPANLKSGQLLQATGVVVGFQMAVDSSAPVQSSAASGLTTDANHLLTAKKSRHQQPWPMSALFVLGFVLGFSRLEGKNLLSRMRVRSLLKQGAIYGLIFAFLLGSMPGYAQNSCSTTGVQQVAVLVVTFPGVPVPTFSPSLYSMFFGPGGSLNDYWQEASYGTTSATGNVFGPFTLSGTYSCSNIRQFMDDSIAAAAQSGVDFNTYNRVNIVFPDMNPSCGWAGISGIGCVSEATPAGTFNVSISALPWTKLTPAVIFHENGHELGLAHARLRTFGSDVLGPIGTSGTLTEYGDHYSAMGVADQGHYAAGQKAEVLGWLASGTTYQNVATSGTYTLAPYETNSGLHALKIQRGTGNPGYYLWVEYRQPLGNYDSTLAYAAAPNGNVFSGALIHYEDSLTSIQTDLLDFTIPDPYADYPALVAGQSWKDPYSDLSLFVVSATSSGLTINVNYSGSVPCTRANPTITASPLNPGIYPGTSAAYGLTITNNDSSGCSPNSFALGSTQPSGWPTSFSASSVTLNPAQSVSVTMTKTGSSSIPPGTYAVDAIASSSSYVGSATANVTILSMPTFTMSLSVVSTSFATRSTVPITATVLNGGTPASGASVTFAVTTPRGNTTTQTASTSSNGTATWNYKLGPNSPTGMYSVTAQAALSSGSKKAASTQTVTSNTITFTVQ